MEGCSQEFREVHTRNGAVITTFIQQYYVEKTRQRLKHGMSRQTRSLELSSEKLGARIH